MEHTCHNCHGALGEEMPFCPNCGSPQLTMSSYEQPVLSLDAGELAAGRPLGGVGEVVHQVDWQTAIHAAMLVAVIGGVLQIVGRIVPASAMLSMMWSCIAAVLTVSLYHRKSPRARLNAGIGARIGIVVGLLLSAVGITVDASGNMIDRYALHQGDAITKFWLTSISDAAAKVMAQYKTSGKFDPQQLAYLQHIWDYLLTPEGLAGLLLLGTALTVMMTLIFCLITGAIGGSLLPRRQPPAMKN
jgi:hypothetical protein